MTSYFFILSGSVFITYHSKIDIVGATAARKLLFHLKKLSEAKDEIAVFTVHETDYWLAKEAKEMKGESYYDLFREFYDVAEKYKETEFKAIKKLAEDKAKKNDFVIIVNNSNHFKGIFKGHKTILVKSEKDALSYAAEEIVLVNG